MPARIVRLPNGLLGRFSTVVDDFTQINLTQYEMQCLLYTNYHMHPLEAKQKIIAGINDIKPFSTQKGSGLDRWYRDLHTIKFRHGSGRVKELIKCLDSRNPG